jgi:hypothetical protein
VGRVTSEQPETQAGHDPAYWRGCPPSVAIYLRDANTSWTDLTPGLRQSDVVFLDPGCTHSKVLTWRHAGELCPVAAEVSLIEIAALEGDLHPGCRRTLERPCEGALEPPHHRVAFRRHPDILGEHLDEAPPAQVEFPSEVADLDPGVVQSGKPGAHGQPALGAVRQARAKGLLEKFEPLLHARCGAESLAEFGRVFAPEVIESDVAVGELARRYSENASGTSRIEVNTEHEGVCSSVDVEPRAVTARNDRATKAALLPADGVVDSKVVFVKVDVYIVVLAIFVFCTT